jgi:hypothetical protein
MKIASKLMMLLAVAIAPLVLAADPLQIIGTGTFGSFTGTFDYNALSSTEATLEITLTNTSPAANGGYITGFAFNNPDNLITDVTDFQTDYPSFEWIFANDGVSGEPFGDFDAGAAIGGVLLGGGSPTSGIGVGETGTFTFTFSGTMLDTLTSASFFSTFSVGGAESAAFLVRFRGFEDDESDKVPGNVIPEPATMLLMGTGLTTLAGIVRRRKMKK